MLGVDPAVSNYLIYTKWEGPVCGSLMLGATMTEEEAKDMVKAHGHESNTVIYIKNNPDWWTKQQANTGRYTY